MNIENPGTLSGQIVESLPGMTPSIEEEDRHQGHFKTDHLLRDLKGHTISEWRSYCVGPGGKVSPKYGFDNDFGAASHASGFWARRNGDDGHELPACF